VPPTSRPAVEPVWGVDPPLYPLPLTKNAGSLQSIKVCVHEVFINLKVPPWPSKGFSNPSKRKNFRGPQRRRKVAYNYSVSRKGTMSDLIFHVYKDDKVKAHNLTAEELETLIHSKQVKLGEDEILPLERSKNTEGSY